MFLALIVILLIALVLFVRRQYTYWEHVGIPSVPANFPFGNLQSIAKKERSFGTAIYDIYKQTTEPFLGIYLFFRPAILVNDAELVKNMLTRDFQYFHDRGVYCDRKNDPMSANLFSLPGEDWKNLRTKLTPVFTSGKLKGMFPIINSVGLELMKHMKPHAEKSETIEIRDLAGRYVVDCLASVAFGQEGISTLDNPEHEFRTNGTKLNNDKSILNVIRGASTFICPRLENKKN
jgi:cytochrome P450 family 6